MICYQGTLLIHIHLDTNQNPQILCHGTLLQPHPPVYAYIQSSLIPDAFPNLILPSDLLGMPLSPLSKSFMETFKRYVINVAVISKDIPYTSILLS